MKSFPTYHVRQAALMLLCAALAASCSGEMNPKPVAVDEETLVSRCVDSMTVLSSENGILKRSFRSPRMDCYEFAREPFDEYPKGIEVISFNDTTGLEASRIIADYALHWTNRDLWELKGNVKVLSIEEDRRLFSQQLFYDLKLKKIYSNVDSKVEEGQDVFIGEGFEADEDMKQWTFRKLKGQVGVDVNSTDPPPESPADSAAKKPRIEEVPAQPDPAEAEHFRNAADRKPRPRFIRENTELTEAEKL